jgi:hypothetical protein
MRKSTLSGADSKANLQVPGTWLDIETLATAEISSEDPQHPFEQALRVDTTQGWRAAVPGPQVVRLRFDTPQSVRRVGLRFREEQVDRFQEIALFATSAKSGRRELVRQQWVFSKGGSTTEVEEYTFDLSEVTLLELRIDPGRHDKHVFASLELIQIG